MRMMARPSLMVLFSQSNGSAHSSPCAMERHRRQHRTRSLMLQLSRAISSPSPLFCKHTANTPPFLLHHVIRGIPMRARPQYRSAIALASLNSD